MAQKIFSLSTFIHRSRQCDIIIDCYGHHASVGEEKSTPNALERWHMTTVSGRRNVYN